MNDDAYYKVLLSARKDNYLRTLSWGLQTLFGVGLPFFFAAMAVKMLSLPVDMMKFVRGGDFLIAAVGVVLPAVMVLGKDRIRPITKTSWMVFVGIMLIAFGSVAYSIIITRNSLPGLGSAESKTALKGPGNLDIDFIYNLTILLVCLSAFYALCTQLVDDVLQNLNPKNQDDQDIQSLADQMRKLQGGQA